MIITSPFDVEVFYDGDCPLCTREINLLSRLDTKSRIRFTDISDSDFSAESVGLPWSLLMARIHARLPDGTLIEGVEVFRRLYTAVGYGRLVQATRWPGVTQALDFAYERFAKNRLRLTGRCVDDTCAVP